MHFEKYELCNNLKMIIFSAIRINDLKSQTFINIH